MKIESKSLKLSFSDGSKGKWEIRYDKLANVKSGGTEGSGVRSYCVRHEFELTQWELRTEIVQMYCKTAFAYCTVLTEAVCLLSSAPPIDLFAEERGEACKAKK